MKQQRKSEGVTLITLVITIIVLLILASVAIVSLIGEKGILTQTIESRKRQEKSSIREEVFLVLSEYQIEKKAKGNTKTLKNFVEEKWNTVVTISGNIYSFIYRNYLFSVNGSTYEILFMEEFKIKVSNTYETVEKMKDDSNLKKNTYVRTLGYYNQELGGGAYYKIVNEELSSQVDDKMIIALNNGLYAKYIVMGNMISAKQMGAYGDGKHDDRLNIQTAVNNLEKGTIYFENGTYKVSSKININKQIALNGENSNNTKIEATEGYALWDNIVKYINTRDIKITNLTFDGYSEVNERGTTNNRGETYQLGSTYQLLNMENVQNILIENCIFRDNVGGGILLKYGSDNFTMNSCELLDIDCGVILMYYNKDTLYSNYTFTNNLFEGHGYSEPISFYSYGEFNNIIIRENIFKNKNYGDGILFDEKAICSDIIVERNKFYGQHAISIKASKMDNIVFSDNYITGVPDLQHAISISGNNENIEIGRNTFDNIEGDVIYTKEDTYVKDFKIHDNIIKINKTNSIFFNNLKSKDLSIYDNQFSYSGSSDIYVYMLRSVTIDNIKIFDNKYSSNKLRKWIDNSTALLYAKESEGGNFAILSNGQYRYIQAPYELNESIIP